jgi:hypothetical protein
MPTRSRRSPIKRRAAWATGVITALAIAAPAGEARAATTVTVPLPPSTTLPAFLAPLLSSLGPSSQGAVAQGGAAIGDVFNGGTTVCVSTAASACSTNGSH